MEVCLRVKLRKTMEFEMGLVGFLVSPYHYEACKSDLVLRTCVYQVKTLKLAKMEILD